MNILGSGGIRTKIKSIAAMVPRASAKQRCLFFAAEADIEATHVRLYIYI